MKTTRALLHKFARPFARPSALPVAQRSAVILLCSLAALTFTASAQQRNTEQRSTDSEVSDRGWRWFEVEVVIFRNLEPSTSGAEQFSLQMEPFNVAASRDLFSPRFAERNLAGYITALPLCKGSKGFLPIVRNTLLTPRLLSNELANYSADSFACYRHEHLPLVAAWYQDSQEQFSRTISAVPTVVSGTQHSSREELLAADIPFLLHQSNFRFNNLRQQFDRRGDTEVLLHTAWAQPVFARNRGRKMRLLGGRNFSAEYDFFGFPKARSGYAELLEELRYSNVSSNLEHRAIRATAATDLATDNMFNDIKTLFTAIERNAFNFVDYAHRDVNLPQRPSRVPAGTPNQVWEFDGLLEIYLVGNFLHIAPEFNLREVITLNPSARSPEQQVDDFLNNNDNSLKFLRNYTFNQLRRVISHQLHYFDHPHYGMVIEIRRTDLSSAR
ncbi:CsiV family protein [Aliidiomarina sp.]|uniref:CsiV family protein n=1 Tax=Aliidiomarina sp. TaxID=1872439 RepID=UPI003A4D9D77